MIVLAVILALLILLALTRFAASAEYNEDGLSVTARIAFIKISFYSEKDKAVKRAKKKLKKKIRPGRFKGLADILPAIKTALFRLRRRLLIKKLVIYYTAAGTDPATTALSFGAASAAFGAVAAALDEGFRIKRRDFRAFADFEAEQPHIYVNAAISLAVWEAVYILFGILPAIAGKKKLSDRKDEARDGK
jgi:hypothetical protein